MVSNLNKSKGVKSHERGGQLIGTFLEIRRSPNFDFNNWIVWSAVRQVAPSCWNHMPPKWRSSNWRKKYFFNMEWYLSPSIVTGFPASLMKKNGPIMPICLPYWSRSIYQRICCFKLLHQMFHCSSSQYIITDKNRF